MPQFSLQTLSSKENPLKEKYQSRCGKIYRRMIKVFSEWLTRKIRKKKKSLYPLFHFSDFASDYFHVLSFCDKKSTGGGGHPDIIG